MKPILFWNEHHFFKVQIIQSIIFKCSSMTFQKYII